MCEHSGDSVLRTIVFPEAVVHELVLAHLRAVEIVVRLHGGCGSCVGSGGQGNVELVVGRRFLSRTLVVVCRKVELVRRFAFAGGRRCDFL